MDDVASVQSENANLRKIQQKLLKWEIAENSLAPLSTFQQDTLEKLIQLSNEIKEKPSDNDALTNIDDVGKKDDTFYPLIKQPIDSIQSFLLFYDDINLQMYEKSNDKYNEYYQQLENRNAECDKLLKQIDLALVHLDTLQNEYDFVSNKTSSLNQASEQLIQEQKHLSEIGSEIKRRLYYFKQAEQLSQRLQSPTMSVSSEIFIETLNKIDECLGYLNINVKFKDASIYTVKYKHCLTKAIAMIKNYVNQIFINATDQVAASKMTPKINDKTSEAAFAIYYGKFQASAPKAKRIISVIEQRIDRSSEYEQVLLELQQSYLTQRVKIMSSGVELAINDLTLLKKGDNCTLVRSACAFIVHVCQDEHRLFYQFFTRISQQLYTYLEGLSGILYDILRPIIIHINHLETLADICSILRVEMIDEHVQYNMDSLEAFGKIANQLLQDVQERLVFRAHLYLQSDILNYKPSPGDLAYPDKLEMMETIAMSLQEPILRRSDSRASMLSQDTESVVEQQIRARSGNSPADLHGMWYPTVRRTLVCLSRLYRCVDRPIFQGLSQEALTYCVQSVSSASQQITIKKSPIDGQLFEIKHLLILREQIAPFRVDFTMKETTLDFSKVKTAAYSLLQKRKQLFALGTNNALLEFLLEGTPQVKEHLHDSRKDVDRQLKYICEQFIKDSTKLLIGTILMFLEKAQQLLQQPPPQQQQSQPSSPQVLPASQLTQVQLLEQKNLLINVNTTKINYSLRQANWASPQQISGHIQESQRSIKNKLSNLQRSMQLYLSNKDTEFILFRPIRNNIIGAFVKLEQILMTNGYTSDDLIITSCPTADQISVLLSSASLLGEQQQILSTTNRKISSSSSIEADKSIRKISIEKKISIDNTTVVPEETNTDGVNDEHNLCEDNENKT